MKRFEFVGSYLYDNGIVVGTIKDNKTIDLIEDLLNGVDMAKREDVERFSYYPFSHMIVDSMTGERYDGNSRTCELLNQESDRADRNAEMNTDEELLKLRWERDIYKNFSDETIKILTRHNVSDLNKLDHILFYARTW